MIFSYLHIIVHCFYYQLRIVKLYSIHSIEQIEKKRLQPELRNYISRISGNSGALSYTLDLTSHTVYCGAWPGLTAARCYSLDSLWYSSSSSSSSSCSFSSSFCWCYSSYFLMNNLETDDCNFSHRCCILIIFIVLILYNNNKNIHNLTWKYERGRHCSLM